ncbi:MAG: hypothetical protein V4519_04520 [Patescibacteria group bacterium]
MIIHIVSTVPQGNSLFRRALDKAIRITGIIPPLHRYGIDALIPWKKPLRSPHASSRNLLHHFKKLGKVKYYSLYEKGVIKLAPDDIFLGQIVPDGGFTYDSRPQTDDHASITSRTLRENPDNHNKYLIIPFANDKALWGWSKDIVENHADKVVLIAGEIWTRNWKDGVYPSLDLKNVVRIDNGIDPLEYPIIKKSFNKPENRKFLYIGHTAFYKNTKELERIAEQMPGFVGGHIGLGNVKGWKKIADFADLTPEFMTKIAEEYDIFVTTSSADAQATTIMENMCFGFPIACTPETGYEYPSIVKLDTTNTEANIKALTMLKNMSEPELKALVDENLKVIQKFHTWNTYVTTISDFMNLK